MRYFLLATVVFALGNLAAGAVVNEYVITETDQPTSLDPLDADQTQNMSVARMIYATPIEIDSADSISSTVLERFDYNKASKTLTWIVRKDLKYSNGQDLTPADVAFAVARMTFTRPEFPVIERIDGLFEWLKTPLPLSKLPRGIKVNGQTISIRLTKDVPHPFFRFCLELFSIIPKTCVDPKTNKVTCQKIPESGRYSISERTSDMISFKRIGASGVPESLVFRYVPAVDLSKKLSSLSTGSVIAGNESMFSEDELRNFSSGSSLYFLPASRFAVLQINPRLSKSA